MMKTLILLSFLFVSGLSMGQTNDLPNRQAFTLKLAVNDSDFYQMDVQSGPIILPENIIQLYPGEKIYVEVELAGKEIKSMKTVKENLHPGKTLIISFSQETEGKKPTGMMLKIENPFKYTLDYKANMFLLKYNKWASTDVSPVGAKLSAFETWPDVIISLALSGWQFNG